MGSARLAQSPTLAIDELVRSRRAAGEQVLHLGFGEAGLPVLPDVGRALTAAVGHNRYGPVAGTPEARAAAAGWFARRGLPTDAAQVVLGPGSKALLFALLAVLPGDVVLPRPSWVSYAAQAALLGRPVISVAIPSSCGGVPDPARLADALAAATRAGRRPGVLLLTLPDNPTGTVAGPDLIRDVCAVAERYGLVVVSDEIYRDLSYQPEQLLSPATVLPDRVIVTGGLSKSMALGGWRIGFTRLPIGRPGEQLRRDLLGVASETWSSLAAPMQHVAGYVLAEPEPVRAYVAASRRLHQAVATAVHAVVVAAGADCRPPAGGFYLYPDLESARRPLAARGVTSSEQLSAWLLATHGIAVLPGSVFGDDPHALRFRVATSLLYGDSDAQRWAALRSPAPQHLPRIQRALDVLDRALKESRQPG